MKTKIIKLGDGCNLTVTIINALELKIAELEAGVTTEEE